MVISITRATLPLAVMTLSVAGPAAAQWYVGLEAGPTYATWTGPAVQASGAWGVHLAAVLERRVGESWTVTLSGVWQQKGADDVRTRSLTGPADFKSSHLTLPVAIGRDVSLAVAWTARPYAGIAVAVTVDCQAKDSSVFSFAEDCGVGLPATEPPTLQLDIPIGVRLARTYPGGSRFVARVQHEIGMTGLLPKLAQAGAAARSRMWLVASGFSLPLF